MMKKYITAILMTLLLVGGVLISTPATAEAQNTDVGPPTEDLEKLAEKMRVIMEEKGLEADVSVTVSERGVVISLKDSVLFAPAHDEIMAKNEQIIVEIGEALKSSNNYVRVEGNTDTVPISNEEFANNWELSVMRATRVLELLVYKSGFPQNKISAIGYGEYRPVAPNTTAEGKSKNRRVDIVILNSDFNKMES